MVYPHPHACPRNCKQNRHSLSIHKSEHKFHGKTSLLKLNRVHAILTLNERTKLRLNLQRSYLKSIENFSVYRASIYLFIIIASLLYCYNYIIYFIIFIIIIILFVSYKLKLKKYVDRYQTRQSEGNSKRRSAQDCLLSQWFSTCRFTLRLF